MMPTTIPGQGPPQPMFNPYQQQQQQPPSLQQLLVGNGMQQPGRDPTSTALVPPTPYSGMPVAMPQHAYVPPQISRRTKLVLGGAGLTLFAAIATVAIIKGAGGGRALDGNGSGTKPTPTVKVQQAEPPKKIEPPKQTTEIATTATTKVDPPKKDPPVVTPIKVDPSKNPQVATVAPTKVDPPKKDPPPVVTPINPPKNPQVAVTPIKVDPPKKDPPKKDPPKKDPPKKDPPPKRDPVVRADPPKKDPPPKKEPPPKRVAMGDSSGIKDKAASLYRAKKFNDAVNVLKEGAKNFSEDEAKQLRSLAGVYLQFGKSYNIGMAPATAAKDAWNALNTAKNMDSGLGREYTEEIQARIGQIAPKAAVAFMAAKDYVLAKQAVGLAESTGNGNSTTAGVKSSLEQKAGELYKEAQALQSTDPDSAKQKFRQVQRMVDSKSQWYQRAGKALSGAT
jgi:hypothetical protein